MALAEFSNAGEAKTAFRALAYKKFKHLPLYLEFAPEGMFQRAADPTRAAKAADSAGARCNEKEWPPQALLWSAICQAHHPLPLLCPAVLCAAAGAVKDVLETEEASAASDSADSRTLFVKNLNFTTTDDAFRGAFKGVRAPGAAFPCSHCAHRCPCALALGACAQVKGLRSAKVARKRDVQKTGATNSLGYGFLEFVSRDAAMEVLKTCVPPPCGAALPALLGSAPVTHPRLPHRRQGTVLDGHKLDLKLARAPQPKARSTTRQVTRAGRQPEGQAGCKITVKNVAFEATRKELRELFGTYGKVR